jgi:hypothetical protein
MSEPQRSPASYKKRSEKGRRARIKVDLWCEILGSREKAVGHIRNLNLGGCKVLSPSAFPIKETVSVVLPGNSSGPDLHLKAQLRWLALNPHEGPFELGMQFVHSDDTAQRLEGVLKGEIKRSPLPPAVAAAPPESYSKFGSSMGTPGQAAGELRRALAEVGLERLINPDPSAPRP